VCLRSGVSHDFHPYTPPHFSAESDNKFVASEEILGLVIVLRTFIYPPL
jgi:hypothetical protein